MEHQRSGALRKGLKRSPAVCPFLDESLGLLAWRKSIAKNDSSKSCDPMEMGW